MKKTVWIYWENLHKNKPEPAYVTLSRLTMLENLTECNLNIVTPDNLEKYLPGINSLIGKIEVDIKGRVDRFTRKYTKNRKNLAVKCDIIRAFLLHRYGGIYIDSDSIVFDDLSAYFDQLEEKEFIIARRNSHGKNHCSVGFYGSQPYSKVITHYVQEITNKLKNSSEVSYNDLGAAMLTPIVDKHIETVGILPESEIQPITFEDAQEVFIDKSIPLEQVFPESQKVFMLFNGPFANELKNTSIEELYSSDYFISRVFRKAITAEKFQQFIRKEMI